MIRILGLLAIIALLCVCVYRLAPVEEDAATGAVGMAANRAQGLSPRDRTAAIQPHAPPQRGAQPKTGGPSHSSPTPLDKLRAATAMGEIPRPQPVTRTSDIETASTSPIFIPTSGGEPRADAAALLRIPGAPASQAHVGAPRDDSLGDNATVATTTSSTQPKPVSAPRTTGPAPASGNQAASRRQAFRTEEFWSEGKRGGM